LCFWENIGRWIKSINMILSSAIHHRENPLQSIQNYAWNCE
jgi:hypothetical protein